MIEGRVARILAPSFVDGPGARMAVFLQGCNLRCRSCHNPETWGICQTCGACVAQCPAQALQRTPQGIQWLEARCRDCGGCEATCPHQGSPRIHAMSVSDLLAQVERWGPLLEGLTFSGGECSLQADFMLAVAEALPPRWGWSVLVDTNGCMAPATLEALGARTRGFLFDFKALDGPLHQRLTGVDNAGILANLARAAALGRLVEVRTVVVPGFVDEPEQLLAMAQWLKAHAPGVPWRLSPFRPKGVREAFPPLEPTRFQALVTVVRKAYGEADLRLGGGSPTR